MEKDLDKFREVGKIGAKIREESKSLVMSGTAFIDIAETIEQMIVEADCKPAFPVNISVNDIAAHYTPEANSEAVLEDGVVKIDIGVELDGAIADTAYTIDLSEKYEDLVKCSEDALANAIAAIKPGVTVGSIGAIVETTAKSMGFKPISNLTGHMIEPYDLHAGIEIPNVKTDDPYEFQVGDVFAVEPFITNGAGYVVDLEQVEIFSLYMPAKIRMRQSRKIVEYVINNYGILPFAERWVRKEFPSKLLVSVAMKELLQNHFLKGYPVLREAGNGMVSQSEHTILVTDSGCEILTK
ncbi:MAG: type II methionyl aminopeptidase [Candidatus Micrarchaeota archaeon]